MNKLVEGKAFVDTYGIKSATFVEEFCGFPSYLNVTKGRRMPYVA